MVDVLDPPLSAEDRRALLEVATSSIRARLLGRPADVADRVRPSTRLREPGASFVTLRRGEALLGCIGTLEPQRPLHLDVARNASAAAFDDPRLPPLTSDDFTVMTVKVSVLSPLERLAVRDERELAEVVQPGVDGLLVASRYRRGTFLPAVWEQLPRPRDFLDALWQKAGLVPGDWPDDLAVWRYRTDELTDPGPRPLDP